MSLDFSHLSSATQTDVGRRRQNNEDSLLAMPDHGAFLVADGMGGSEAGEVASGKVVEIIHNVFDTSRTGPVSAKASVAILKKGLDSANKWIWRHAREQGMKSCGTTAVGLVFDPVRQNRAAALNVGDSRAYRFRDGRLEQLTADHSFAAAAGVKDESLLPARFRSIITRAVGIADAVQIDVTAVDVAADDLFLICSDGLTRMLPDEQLERILSNHEKDDLKTLVNLLIDRANEAGGHDNITAIVIRAESVEDPGGDDPDDGTSRTLGMDEDMTRDMTLSMTGAEWDTFQGRDRRMKIILGIILLILFIITLITLESYLSDNDPGKDLFPDLEGLAEPAPEPPSEWVGAESDDSDSAVVDDFEPKPDASGGEKPADAVPSAGTEEP